MMLHSDHLQMDQNMTECFWLAPTLVTLERQRKMTATLIQQHAQATLPTFLVVGCRTLNRKCTTIMLR